MRLLYPLAENRIHLSSEELLQVAELYDFLTYGSSYIVFLLSRFEDCDSIEKVSQYIELERILQRYTQKNSSILSWDSDGSTKCLVLASIIETGIDDEVRISEHMKDYLVRHGIDNVTIACGGRVDKIEDIHYSFERAQNTINFIGASSEARICFARDYEHLFELPVLQSIVEPEHILRLFNTGSLEDLKKAVTQATEQIRSLSGYADEPHHPTSIRRTFIEWTVYILHVCADMGVDVDSVLGDVDPYRHLMTISGGTPAIIDWFIDFCGKMRESIRMRQESKEDQLIHRAKALIDSHITNYDFSLTQLSESLRVSTAYLSRLLTKRLNTGFSQYLSQRRIEIVCEKLIMTDLTVDQIAAETGYSSGAYLGRRFKQVIGCTPNEYRHQHR